jgi:hypothetical protein
LASTQSEKDYAIAPLAKIPSDFHSPGQAFVQCSMKSKILTTAIFLVPLVVATASCSVYSRTLGTIAANWQLCGV